MQDIISIFLTLALAFNVISNTLKNEDEESPEDWALDRVYFSMSDEQRAEASIEIKARAVGMTVEEFDLMSRTIEAESDRSNNLEGRVLIAIVIFNRVGVFADSITGVITQAGQFQVYEDGVIYSVGRTTLSDQAIIEAHARLAEGEAPAIMYFNNQGYNGNGYCECGGNYFSF